MEPCSTVGGLVQAEVGVVVGMERVLVTVFTRESALGVPTVLLVDEIEPSGAHDGNG